MLSKSREKVIKLNDWSATFERRVAEIRAREVNVVRKLALFIVVGIMAIIGTPQLVAPLPC